MQGERNQKSRERFSVLLTNWLCLEVGWQTNLTHTLAIDCRQSHWVGCLRFQATDSDCALHICCCRNEREKAKKHSSSESSHQCHVPTALLTHLDHEQSHINSEDKEKGQRYHFCLKELIREGQSHSLSRGDVVEFTVDTKGNHHSACTKLLLKNKC